MSPPAPRRRLSAHLPLRITAAETTAPPQIEYHVVNCRPGHQGNQRDVTNFPLDVGKSDPLKNLFELTC